VPHPSVGAVYAELAQQHGLDRQAEVLEAAFPAAFRAVQQRWGVPYGVDDEDARRFWIAVIHGTFAEPLSYELCMDLYDAFAEARRWRVLPGAREALTACAALGLPTAVVSNFDCRLVPVLAACDLHPTIVVPSTVVGRAKPDPAVLLHACRQLSVNPSEVLHLGDSEREDGGMCRAAGARFMLVDGEIPRLETLLCA
jgi:putative hydrolase of the HAD superfamily